MFQRIIDAVCLPDQITEFERRYLERMNKIGFCFFAAHLPVFVLLAYSNGTGPLLALLLTAAVLVGPALAFLAFDNPRHVSLTHGFTAMLMGGILVHVGQGPVQIEMHFYFFALLAMLAIYGNPLVILVAAVTVALHHLAGWWLVPSSVFNYDAPIWVVLVHAAFVVLESVATCYIARNFFDNVIGLERIVQARTAETNARNRDMRLLLDNVGQGFLTVDRTGVVSTEHSAILERWLGKVVPHTSFAAYLGAHQPVVGESFEVGLEALLEDFLPEEVVLDQLPKRLVAEGRSLTLGYSPIKAGGTLQKLLVVITDVTSQLERERLEREQREMFQIFDRLMRDRAGFLEFFDEAGALVAAVGEGRVDDLTHLKRVIHTLKGDTAMFGINSIADYCHQLETGIDEEHVPPAEAERAELVERYARLRTTIDVLLGGAVRAMIEVEPAEYEEALHALQRDEPRGQLARRMAAWRLEPTARRLDRIAEQVQRIAARLNKGPLKVRITDHGLRLESRGWASFWSSFVHVVRNAVDHGIEPKEARKAAGKEEFGAIELSTSLEGDAFLIEIRDDGRGIDWEAVRERARKAGLPHAKPADLLEAIFTDGISTAKVVSELSGRGVGMGAMRAECAARGGAMDVSSVAGAGTRIVFRFPASAMTGGTEARAA